MKIIQQSARILTPEDGMQALRQIEQAGRVLDRDRVALVEQVLHQRQQLQVQLGIASDGDMALAAELSDAAEGFDEE